MINKIVSSPLAVLCDGAIAMIGGFGPTAQPNELVNALIETGARVLAIVDNDAGNGNTGLAHLLAFTRV
jgi:3-oxoadipate CoA-transferase alpha subunit